MQQDIIVLILQITKLKVNLMLVEIQVYLALKVHAPFYQTKCKDIVIIISPV